MNNLDKIARYISYIKKNIKKIASLKLTKDDFTDGFFLGIRNIIILIAIFMFFLYANPIYQFHTKPQIESYLDETSERICKYSDDDAEIVQQIIAWENSESLDLKRFTKKEGFLRLSGDARWYIYMGKANCGERAIIFEDMADRCGLTYRHIEMEGYIYPKDNSSSDHAWTEVWIDNEWRIADSGFHMWYPQSNQLNFTSEYDFLIGHVSVIDNSTYSEDCTDSYVSDVCQLNIEVLEKNNPVKKANVFVSMEYNNTKIPVIGYKRKFLVNDSGVCTTNLGIYNETFYSIKASYEGLLYEHYGTENIILEDGVHFLLINVTDKKFRWMN
jgi:hypothetical protein